MGWVIYWIVIALVFGGLGVWLISLARKGYREVKLDEVKREREEAYYRKQGFPHMRETMFGEMCLVRAPGRPQDRVRVFTSSGELNIEARTLSFNELLYAAGWVASARMKAGGDARGNLRRAHQEIVKFITDSEAKERADSARAEAERKESDGS
jgi:hypothetical protein